MTDFDFDLLIKFIGKLSPEVTGVDALLYAYNRIGQDNLDGYNVAFSADFLDDTYDDVAGFVARLMGADEGIIAIEGGGAMELTYDVNGLAPLVLRDSDRSVIRTEKCEDELIDIALTGVIYKDLPDLLVSALKTGRGVNNSVYLTTINRFNDETSGVKNTYNIITEPGKTEKTFDSIVYNDLYYASHVTVVSSAVYGYISSGKCFY